MSDITITGAGTGFDWDEIIRVSLDARRRQVIAPLENWREDWTSKQEHYGRLQDKIVELRSAVDSISTPDDMRAYRTDVGDESVLSVAAGGRMYPGTYGIEVNQLANAAVEISNNGFDSNDAVISEGADQEFSYIYGGSGDVLLTSREGFEIADETGTIVTLDDGETADFVYSYGGDMITVTLEGTQPGQEFSLQDLVDALNEDPEKPAGVTANAGEDAETGHWHLEIAGDVLLEGIEDAGDFDGGVLESWNEDRDGEIVTLRMNEDGVTLKQLVDSINNDSGNPGVSASILDDGSEAGSHFLRLRGQDSGARYGINVLTTPDGFGGFDSIIKAQNAQVRIDGHPSGEDHWIERESNLITDVIPGVSLTLRDTGSTTVTVNTDIEGVKENIRGFVDAYNKVKSFINQKTRFDEENNRAGEMQGDYAVRIADQILRSSITGVPPGFDHENDTYTLPAQVGIRAVGLSENPRDLGLLEIDENILDQALADDFHAVIALFSDDYRGITDGADFSYYQSSNMLTTPGSYDVRAEFGAGGELTGGWFKLSSEDESAWRPAELSESGNYLVGAAGHPEHALYVRPEHDGESEEQTGTVRLRQGITGSMSDELLRLTGEDGLFRTQDGAYTDIIDSIDRRIEDEERRLDQMRARLIEKYARAEQALNQMQGRMDWMQQMMQQGG